MDKHDRPYVCSEPGCEKLRGFTYSGGLLRHQREVHRKKGVHACPYENCKRHTKPFTRNENLEEHKRRCHNEDRNATPVSDSGRPSGALRLSADIGAMPGVADSVELDTGLLGDPPPGDGDVLAPGAGSSAVGATVAKRKRDAHDEVVRERREVKKLRLENHALKQQIGAMLAQIAELQDTLAIERARDRQARMPSPML